MEQPSSPTESTSDPERAFVSNYAMLVRIGGKFSNDQLQKALDCLRARHGLLIPGAASDDPIVSHFPLRLLTNCGNTDWMEIVKEELRQPFRGNNGPFARFILLRLQDCSDLIGTFHHGVSDGMTGVYVLRDILRLLGEPSVELPALPAPPDFFTLIPKSVKENPRVKFKLRVAITMFRVSRFFRRLGKRILPNVRKSQQQQPVYAGEDLPPGQRFCILTETLTAAQTTALVERCRAEETSVHATVCTAWLRAFANMPEGRKSWIRCTSSPINLRDRVAQPLDETAGMFMSILETRVNCAPGREFWQIAREFRRRLKRGSTDEKVFMFPLMINAFLSQFSGAELGDVFDSFFNRPVKYDFSVTNLGRLDFPDRVGSLRIEAFHNLVNSSEYERTVSVNTFNGRMTFIFMFRESKMDPRAGEILMDRAIEQLAKASGDDTTLG